MIKLLEIKEYLKGIYGKYSIVIDPALRFLVAFLAMHLINQNIGFMSDLANPLTELLVALICALLPYGLICWILGAVILVHVFTISKEMAAILGTFLICVAFLYYSFRPGDSIVLIMTPVLFALKIPYLIPLLIGLGTNVLSVIPMSAGIVICYVISFVKNNAGALTNDSSVNIAEKFLPMVRGVFANRTMLITIIAFALALLIVYLIHLLQVNYAWYYAAAAGTAVMIIVFLTGRTIFGITLELPGFFLGILASLLLAAAYIFFEFSVDYSRTEYTQMEDDDYIYYVKAVPKMSVNIPDLKVQIFRPRRQVRRGDEQDT